jgi:hypothetical protein
MNINQKMCVMVILIVGLAASGCGPGLFSTPTPTVTPSLTPRPMATMTPTHTPSPTPPPVYTTGGFNSHGYSSDINFTVREGGMIDHFKLKFDIPGGSCAIAQPEADTWRLKNDGTFSVNDGGNFISFKVNGKIASVPVDIRFCEGKPVSFNGEFILFGRPLAPFSDIVPGNYEGTNVSFTVRDTGEKDNSGSNLIDLARFKLFVKSSCGDVIDIDKDNTNALPGYRDPLYGNEHTYFSAVAPFYNVSVQVEGRSATVVWEITCAWPNPNKGYDNGTINDIQLVP